MYLIDSCALIEPKNHWYAMDICPAFWSFIDQKMASGEIVSIRQVYNEIISGDDDLAGWVKGRDKFFPDYPGQDIQQVLADVSNYVNKQFNNRASVDQFFDKADHG